MTTSLVILIIILGFASIYFVICDLRSNNPKEDLKEEPKEDLKLEKLEEPKTKKQKPVKKAKKKTSKKSKKYKRND